MIVQIFFLTIQPWVY